MRPFHRQGTILVSPAAPHPLFWERILPICVGRSEEPATSDDDTKTEKKGNSMLGAGIAIGIAIGAGIGVALGNVAIGMGLGIAIGVALGLAMGKSRS